MSAESKTPSNWAELECLLKGNGFHFNDAEVKFTSITLETAKWQRIIDDLRAAQETIARLTADAERYQWLRNFGNADDETPQVALHTQSDWGKWLNTWLSGDALDAAIDAAREPK